MSSLYRCMRLTPLVHVNRNALKFVCFSTAAAQDVVPLQHFRTSENNPSNHTLNHVGKFYLMPQDLRKKVFHIGGVPKSLDIQMQTFRECAIMVREPAIEIISILKRIDFSHPAVRFVLYGANGTGKTSTLIHVVHYLYDSKFLLVHVPWAPRWIKHVKEVVDSQYKERRIDLPVDSALWLQHFKSQNSLIMKELDLRVSKSYTWSKREVTEEGAPLMDVIEHGIERVRHASDCLAVLLKEIKLHSQSGRFKTAVVVDGVNAFYSKTNTFQFKRADRSVAVADDITIVRAVKKILNNDWNNTVIITSVDTMPYDRNAKLYDPYTPRHLLGKEGFELLDPFIPIHTVNFTDKELMNTLDYYCDRLWIQSEYARSDEGRKQLKFLSGNNPMELKKLCDPL